MKPLSSLWCWHLANKMVLSPGFLGHIELGQCRKCNYSLKHTQALAEVCGLWLLSSYYYHCVVRWLAPVGSARRVLQSRSCLTRMMPECWTRSRNGLRSTSQSCQRKLISLLTVRDLCIAELISVAADECCYFKESDEMQQPSQRHRVIAVSSSATQHVTLGRLLLDLPTL